MSVLPCDHLEDRPGSPTTAPDARPRYARSPKRSRLSGTLRPAKNSTVAHTDMLSAILPKSGRVRRRLGPEVTTDVDVTRVFPTVLAQDIPASDSAIRCSGKSLHTAVSTCRSPSCYCSAPRRAQWDSESPTGHPLRHRVERSCIVFSFSSQSETTSNRSVRGYRHRHIKDQLASPCLGLDRSERWTRSTTKGGRTSFMHAASHVLEGLFIPCATNQRRAIHPSGAYRSRAAEKAYRRTCPATEYEQRAFRIALSGHFHRRANPLSP